MQARDLEELIQKTRASACTECGDTGEGLSGCLSCPRAICSVCLEKALQVKPLKCKSAFEFWKDSKGTETLMDSWKTALLNPPTQLLVNGNSA